MPFAERTGAHTTGQGASSSRPPGRIAFENWGAFAVAAALLVASPLAGTIAAWARIHRPNNTAWISRLNAMFWMWPVFLGWLSWTVFANLQCLGWRAMIAVLGVGLGVTVVMLSRLPRFAVGTWRGRPLAGQLRVAGFALIVCCAAGALLAAMSTSSSLR